jgi:hypothetical protein
MFVLSEVLYGVKTAVERIACIRTAVFRFPVLPVGIFSTGGMPPTEFWRSFSLESVP